MYTIKINSLTEKSSFIGFGLSPEELTGCSRILATPTGTLPIRYLGFPLVDRRLHSQDWQPVLEKVESRLAGWRACLLSRGGRLVLLKALLEAIPIYFMSIFRMPVGVRRRLEWSMRDFFYRGPQNEESWGMALVPWETLCRPVDQGSLGIRQLMHTNTTLLSKWVSEYSIPRASWSHQCWGRSIETRWTGSFGRPQEGGTLHFCPLYAPFSRRFDLSSVPGLGQGRPSASGCDRGVWVWSFLACLL